VERSELKHLVCFNLFCDAFLSYLFLIIVHSFILFFFFSSFLAIFLPISICSLLAFPHLYLSRLGSFHRAWWTGPLIPSTCLAGIILQFSMDTLRFVLFTICSIFVAMALSFSSHPSPLSLPLPFSFLGHIFYWG
jgi:hypothetical protein